MFVSSKAPFYRLARIIHLGYMEKEPLIADMKGFFISDPLFKMWIKNNI